MTPPKPVSANLSFSTTAVNLYDNSQPEISEREDACRDGHQFSYIIGNDGDYRRNSIFLAEDTLDKTNNLRVTGRFDYWDFQDNSKNFAFIPANQAAFFSHGINPLKKKLLRVPNTGEEFTLMPWILPGLLGTVVEVRVDEYKGYLNNTNDEWIIARIRVTEEITDEAPNQVAISVRGLMSRQACLYHWDQKQAAERVYAENREAFWSDLNPLVKQGIEILFPGWLADNANPSEKNN